MSYIAPTTAGWTSQKFGTNPGGFNPSGGHTGEDIAIPVGTPLVAMADGVVVHVGYFSGTYSDNPYWIQPSFAGFVVTVDYGPYVSHYAHCSSSPVKVGQRVTQRQVVAYSGNTGSATSGPHLHWEVMPDGWNLNTNRYGRINPRSIISTITYASTEEIDMAIPATQAEDIAQRAAALVIAWMEKGNVKIHPVQAESIVAATTDRVTANLKGDKLAISQADGTAQSVINLLAQKLK